MSVQLTHDSVDKAMTKLVQLRLTLRGTAPTSSSSLSSSTNDACIDLASEISNCLTSALVDLRQQVRDAKSMPNAKAAVLESAPCSCCEHSPHRGEHEEDGCVHRTALADRVIDRAFDKHKSLLRQSLREAEAELAKFRSGAMVQQLQRRIDELELKLRAKTTKEPASVHVDRSKFVVAAAPPSASASASEDFSLGGIDSMIASFKKRCEVRHTQRERQEQQQQEQQNQQRDEQQARALEKLQQQQRERDQQQQQQRLLLESSSSRFASHLATLADERATYETAKASLFVKSSCAALLTTTMMAQQRLTPKPVPAPPTTTPTALPPLKPSSRGDSPIVTVQQQQQQQQPPQPLTARSSWNQQRSATNNGKTLDVSRKPLHPRRM